MSDTLSGVAKSLVKLHKVFLQEPNRFFTERDIHHYLWENMISEDLGRMVVARDGNTVLLHSEYPHEHKIRYAYTYHDKNRDKFDPLKWRPGDSIKVGKELSDKEARNARRPYCDIIILAEERIRQYQMDEINRKEYEKSAKNIVDVAIEVKLIPECGLTVFEMRGVLEDFDKLLKSSEAKHKIQVIVDKGNVKNGIPGEHLSRFKKFAETSKESTKPHIFLVAGNEPLPYDPAGICSCIGKIK